MVGGPRPIKDQASRTIEIDWFGRKESKHKKGKKYLYFI